MPSFNRRGQPVRVPFNATSASTEFDILMPMEARKTFLFVNATPYDVRLEGTAPDTTFIPVTDSKGWLVPARSVMGPFTSKNPAKLSCQAFSTPGNPFAQGADFTGCFLELIYGEGE